EYNIFTASQSLKGTIGYCLVRRSGFSGKELLLDPFAKTGIIPIEAALFATGFPVNYFQKQELSFSGLFSIDFDAVDSKISKGKFRIYCMDKDFPMVSHSKKNAKIAGVEKFLQFSRLDVEWLDTKFREKEVDIICSYPPQPSRRISDSDLMKIYNELFYQAKFVLDKKGTICLIAKEKGKLEKAAQKHGFRLDDEEVWMQGKQPMKVLIFKV
ncbi:methyltransferase, partial [Candidatus Woesearchaeota archaeon]|nr:methyltransferase [Candidatus Woesearchaeota archaeon]